MKVNCHIKCAWAGFLFLASTMSFAFAEEITVGTPSRVECIRMLDELNASLKTTQASYAEQLNCARRLYELGNLAHASELVDEVLNNVDENSHLVEDALFLSASIAYLTGDYEQAEKRYSAVQDIPDSSLSAKAKVGLLHTYFQTNQFHKADTLYSANTEPNDAHADRETRSAIAMWNMMRRFSENEPYQIAWHDDGNQAVIPFVAMSPLPVIEAEVNGRKINLLLDTGGGILMVDSGIASSLGIAEIDSDEGIYAGGKTREFSYGKADSLTLAGVTLHSFPIEMTPVSWISTDINTSEEFVINGIIGIDTLRHFLTTIDYPGQRLVLQPRQHRLRPNSPRTEHHVCREEVTVPFTLASTHLVLAKGGIDSKDDLTIFLDSGLNHPDAAVLLPSQTLEYAGIPIPQTNTPVDDTDMVLAGGFSVGAFAVDSFRVGKLEQMDLLGLYGVFPPELYFGGLFDNTYPFFIDGLVSHNFLKQYKWTIDFDSMTMHFCR